MTPKTTPGHDTATGSDPDAKYEQPGYEDKSFGQAVEADQKTVDRLLEESDGDVTEAERRFQQESAGASVIKGQHAGAPGLDADPEHATGEAKAKENQANESPA